MYIVLEIWVALRKKIVLILFATLLSQELQELQRYNHACEVIGKYAMIKLIAVKDYKY